MANNGQAYQDSVYWLLDFYIVPKKLQQHSLGLMWGGLFCPACFRYTRLEYWESQIMGGNKHFRMKQVCLLWLVRFVSFFMQLVMHSAKRNVVCVNHAYDMSTVC